MHQKQNTSMGKKLFLISLSCLVIQCSSDAVAQSKRIYSNSQLSFQYGFSVKGLVEFSFTRKSQKPVFRLCSDFGIGSNVLARSLYFSINTELQLYNGGLGSRRREENKRPELRSILLMRLHSLLAFGIT